MNTDELKQIITNKLNVEIELRNRAFSNGDLVEYQKTSDSVIKIQDFLSSLNETPIVNTEPVQEASEVINS